MNRLIFVGMHNKAGMKPLDSKTMSGKMIDSVVQELGRMDAIKTNLCEVEYLPVDQREIWAHNLSWNDKYEPDYEDIIVLLGAWVHKNFALTNAKIVKLPHPASWMGITNKDSYRENAVQKIKAKTNPQ